MDKILKVHDYLDSLPEIGKVLSFGSILRVAEDLNKKELQSLEIAVLYSKIPEEIKQEIETFKNIALNERDYGDLSGLNKDEARKEWGEEQVHIWRRSYDIPPPGGESLKDTLNRVLPYFEKIIKPELDKKKNILVTAHGNSLRALIKKIENISSDDIVKLEIATGEPIIYSFFEERFTRLTV